MTTQAGAPICPLGRFHHVGIVVHPSQYQDTVSALCRLLDGFVSEGGQDDELDMKWAFVTSAANPPIEVASPLGHQVSGLTRYLERHGSGLHHVSFETSDLDAVSLHVDGVDLPQIGRSEDHGGYAELFVHPKALGGALFHVLEDRRDQPDKLS